MINSDVDYLCALSSKILASILLQAFRFLKSFPSLMHLQSRERTNVRCPGSQRERPLARPCCGGKEQQSFMLWGQRKILRAQVHKALLKFSTCLFAAWCVFHLGVRKDWDCFGWACEVQHQWRRESDWSPSPHHQSGSHLHPVWFW